MLFMVAQALPQAVIQELAVQTDALVTNIRVMQHAPRRRTQRKKAAKYDVCAARTHT